MGVRSEEDRTGGTGNQKKSKAKRFLETSTVTIIFIGLVIYTDFHHRIFTDPKINRKLLWVAILATCIFTVLYFWLVYQLRWSKPKEKRIPVNNWCYISPTLVTICTICVGIVIISLISALYPAFQLTALLLSAMGFMTVNYILQWIPI